MHTLLGDTLLQTLKLATKEVVIVAPFIKDNAFARALEAIPPCVQSIVCITRWLPQEVAAGVSDLEILDRLIQRTGAQLRLHPNLHAKYYRADARCLIGSANMTGRALGWSSPPNLELLFEADANGDECKSFETMLLAVSTPANLATQDAVREAAEKLKKDGLVPTFGATELDLSQLARPNLWLPSCATPDRLWNVYTNHETYRLVASAAQAAQEDIAALGVPPGLSKPLFDAYIAASLLQMPLVKSINEMAAHGLADERAIAFVREAVPEEAAIYTPENTWIIVKAWLMHFFANRYVRSPTGESITLGRRIS